MEFKITKEIIDQIRLASKTENGYEEYKVISCLEDLGEDISQIINIDGDEMSDGEVVDTITEYLQDRGLYKPRV